MNKFILLLLTITIFSCQEKETGQSIVNKSITFHDPEGEWMSLSARLEVKLVMPNAPDRLSDIELDFPKDYFKLTEIKESDTLVRIIDKGECKTLLNGTDSLDEATRKTSRLRCEDASMYRNYYPYLYGLPMKLTDEGTLIDPIYSEEEFNGKRYLKVKVTYDETVGKDTWYFYFDPETYAMEVYQFYHVESENDGEYIILEGLENLGELKLPKTRHWFVNKDDRLLGTDILTKITKL